MNSVSGHKDVGRPDANVGAGFLFLQYCGGKGGSGCLDPIGVTGVVIPYKMPRSIVRHRRLLFENKPWTGVRIFTDGGSAFLCDHSLGSEVGFYIMLSNSSTLDEALIQRRGQFVSGVLPYDIEFLEKDIPQPKDILYDGFIYLHLYWGNAGYINEGSTIPDENSFRIVKHDYDIQL